MGNEEMMKMRLSKVVSFSGLRRLLGLVVAIMLLLGLVVSVIGAIWWCILLFG